MTLSFINITRYDVKVPVSINISKNRQYESFTYYVKDLHVIIRHYDVKVTVIHIILRVQA